MEAEVLQEFSHGFLMFPALSSTTRNSYVQHLAFCWCSELVMGGSLGACSASRAGFVPCASTGLFQTQIWAGRGTGQ